MEPRSADAIVFVGDVHLGRRPVGLDDVLGAHGLSARDISPAAALAGLVDALLEQPPRAVVFAGDLVDSDDDRFEAGAQLEAQVARLAAAGVPVLAVAGNHDGLVLPRLVQRVPGVSLLGAGGRWESWVVPGDGTPIDLLGWSFPARHYETCPLDAGGFDEARARLRAGALTLGVLHADLDAGRSRYAPVSRARLEQVGLDGWFLGHVHEPGELSAAVPIGYLGSLVGLDAGEPGPRGPWRVYPATGGGVAAEQLSLAPLRYETLQVPLEEEHGADADTLRARLQEVVLAALSSDPTLDQQRLRAVLVRARFSGRLARRGALAAFVERQRPDDLVFFCNGRPVIVEAVRDETREAIDLLELAGEASPLGDVAARLLALRQGDLEAALPGAAAIAQSVARGGWRVDDGEHPLPAPEVLLERAARRLLEMLLEQRRQGAAG